MKGQIRRAFAVVLTGISIGACTSARTEALPPSGPPPGEASGTPQVNPDAKALATFQSRVKDYVSLHQKLEGTLASLPREATPQQIDQHQRALGKLIQESRSSARPGDLFTPESQRVVRELMKRVFGGADGAQLKSSIHDENPGRLKLTVNSRYPDSVPLSTVPPQVLAGLPKLPEELEYRFIGRTLILMDVHAHIIVDLVENAIPA